MSENTVSASAIVDATPAEVFDFVRRPVNHEKISGDGSVKGSRFGPEQLSMGDKFGMSMRMGVPYRMSSTVVEFEQDRVIAWCHLGKHRWRWEVEPAEDGKTKVTETFDMNPSPLKPMLRVLGYPAGHQDNVQRSVDNVAAHFAG